MPIYGTSGNDSLTGGAGTNVIYGLDGRDTLVGGAGADSISGGAGNDMIVGGSFIGAFGETGFEVLYGGDGDDILYSASGSNALPGYDSLDSFYYVIGGSGDDLLVGNFGNEIFADSSGEDTIIGGGGRDIYAAGPDQGFLPLIFPDEPYVFVTTPIFLHRAGNTVTDGEGDVDTLVDIERVYLFGGEGDDILINESASTFDQLMGFVGDDFLYINGDVSSSEVDGGAGADTLIGGALGRNIFRLDDGDVVAGGGSPDTFFLYGLGFFNPLIDSPISVSILDFGKDNGSPSTTLEFVQFDVFDGDDRKTLDPSSFVIKRVNEYTVQIKIDVTDDAVTDATITFYGFFEGSFEFNENPILNTNNITFDGENTAVYLTGMPTDDTLSGGGAGEIIFGFAGDDNLSGGGGVDVIFGDVGADTLYGGVGDDTLRGGVDNDRIKGGSGFDLIYGDNGNDYIDGGSENDDLRGSAGNDTVLGGDGRDVIRGNSGDDDIRGGAGGDTLAGGLDNDEIRGASGDDAMKGEAGDDILFAGIDDDLVRGNEGADTLLGGEGNDSLQGNPGDDELYGQAGDDDLRGGNDNDTLAGGSGNDTLRGNSGDDVFIYTPGADNDLIIGFEGGAGAGDVIDLSVYDGIFDDFTNVQAAMADDGFGNVVIDLGGGDTITLANVLAADLDADDFLFV